MTITVTKNSRRRINWRRCGALVLRALRETRLLRNAVVVLFGSYARNADTWRSDVDILVLHNEPLKFKLQVPNSVHLHWETFERFKQRLAEGDDFVISALRYGKLLYDRSDFWQVQRRAAESAQLPDWADKLDHAERRLKLADNLFKIGDIEASTEEYLFAATQLSRAILLHRGIYPLSRGELSKQLLTIGQDRLAADVQTLIKGECKQEDLSTIGKNLTMLLSLTRRPETRFS